MDPLYIQQIDVKSELPREEYYAKIGAVKHILQNGALELSNPVTFFMGENGSGKSTLIEAIAVAYGFNPEGGTGNFNFETRSSHSQLFRYVKLIKGYKRPENRFFLRAESFYNVATNIDELDSDPYASFAPPIKNSYGGISLHEKSHGESFLTLVENRFGKNGLYILDEPEAALSPTGILRLMVRMDELVKQGSQFIISTHSPILSAFPNAEIFELSDDGITPIPYKQTSHYVITKRFLDDPNGMLKYMLEADD